MKTIKLFEEFINEAVKREDKKLVKDVTAYAKSKGLQAEGGFDMGDQFNDGDGGVSLIGTQTSAEECTVDIGWQDDDKGYTVIVGGNKGHMEDEYNLSAKEALAILKEYIGKYH